MISSAVAITTPRLQLRPATAADANALLHYHLTNRTHFKPWQPLRDDNFYTLAATEQRLLDMEGQMAAGNALYLLLWKADTHDTQTLLGECNFTNIIHGPFQACYLGFSIDQASEGQGLMREALHSAIEFMFSHGNLHRIMANYRPENLRSGQLLQRLGFETEGRARAYLKINGEWCDHILTALINDSDAAVMKA